MTSVEELRELMAKDKINKRIYFDGLEVYLRISHYPYKGRICKKLVQLASLDADEPGKGALRRFLPVVEKLAIEADIPLILVENVLNERLIGFLGRAGWDRHDKHSFDVLFFKELRPFKETDWIT